MNQLVVRGVRVPGPVLMYGTAWKEERTAELTRQALEMGIRSIDTACQRKHYFEAGVGEAIADWFVQTGAAREALFLQTKYTYRRGQDDRLPYDPKAPFDEQVAQSFATSLRNLRVDTIDSYVLHGPSTGRGLTDDDWVTWGAMEKLVRDGHVRMLGISNVTDEQLQALVAGATIKPAFVQNRCYARYGWDLEVRATCREHDIVYQGFSLLTANRAELAGAVIPSIAERRRIKPQQVVFAFARQVGMLPLTGSSSREHLALDIAALDMTLTPEEVAAVAHVSS